MKEKKLTPAEKKKRELDAAKKKAAAKAPKVAKGPTKPSADVKKSE